MLGPSRMEGAARASVPSDAAASPGHAEGKRHAEWKQRVRVGRSCSRSWSASRPMRYPSSRHDGSLVTRAIDWFRTIRAPCGGRESANSSIATIGSLAAAPSGSRSPQRKKLRSGSHASWRGRESVRLGVSEFGRDCRRRYLPRLPLVGQVDFENTRSRAQPRPGALSAYATVSTSARTFRNKR